MKRNLLIRTLWAFAAEGSALKSLIALSLLVGMSALAVPVTPTFGTFGPLPGATFGGSGIPNDAVAITTITAGSDTITLGLTAHQRFANPPLANNGAGVFTAGPGSNFGDPTGATMPSSTLGATWNFAFYIDIAGGGTTSDYLFELRYDFHPAAGTDESAHGTINLSAVVLLPPPFGAGMPVSHVEDSQNLLFGFLATPAPPFITPPPGSFDPNAVGEYTFALVTKSSGGSELGRSAIQVNVSSVPEVASTGTLLLLGIGSVLGLGRRMRSWR